MKALEKLLISNIKTKINFTKAKVSDGFSGFFSFSKKSRICCVYTWVFGLMKKYLRIVEPLLNERTREASPLLIFSVALLFTCPHPKFF